MTGAATFWPMFAVRAAPDPLRRFAAVFAGAAVGTAGRIVVAAAVAGAGWASPTATVVVNLAGAFVLGWFVGWRDRRPGPGRILVTFWGIGMLGAFTTFAGFAKDIVQIAGDRWLGALVYGVGSILVGVAVATAGIALGRR